MNTKLILTTGFLGLATAAFAEPSCEPTEVKQPVWEAIKAFEEEGGEVTAFKINSGDCYEIYGRLDGDKYEIFYDPATGDEIERIKD